jgi:hypothetical protein
MEFCEIENDFYDLSYELRVGRKFDVVLNVLSSYESNVSRAIPIQEPIQWVSYHKKMKAITFDPALDFIDNVIHKANKILREQPKNYSKPRYMPDSALIAPPPVISDIGKLTNTTNI